MIKETELAAEGIVVEGAALKSWGKREKENSRECGLFVVQSIK